MRSAYIERNTQETKIQLSLNLDGQGKADIDSGIGFFDHMMNLLAFHSGMDISLRAQGDLDVDDHHTIEDIGIAFGEAFLKAIGDKKGIERYGNFRCCMDEALACVDTDVSGRGYLVFHADFNRDMIGMMATEMVKEFFYAFAMHSGVTLHINLLYGENDHHKAEALFKALGKAIKEAKEITSNRLVSTKGIL